MLDQDAGAIPSLLSDVMQQNLQDLKRVEERIV
jgi:hypothetical protein